MRCKRGSVYSMSAGRCIVGRNPIRSLKVSRSGVTMLGDRSLLTEAYMDKAIDLTADIVGEDGIKGLAHTSFPTNKTMKTNIRFEKGVPVKLKHRVKARLAKL